MVKIKDKKKVRGLIREIKKLDINDALGLKAWLHGYLSQYGIEDFEPFSKCPEP